MSEANALSALKNAWNGALGAAEELRKMAPVVAGLDDADASKAIETLNGLDLAVYRRATLANATAAEALRGLIEEFQRKRDEGKQV